MDDAWPWYTPTLRELHLPRSFETTRETDYLYAPKSAPPDISTTSGAKRKKKKRSRALAAAARALTLSRQAASQSSYLSGVGGSDVRSSYVDDSDSDDSSSDEADLRPGRKKKEKRKKPPPFPEEPAARTPVGTIMPGRDERPWYVGEDALGGDWGGKRQLPRCTKLWLPMDEAVAAEGLVQSEYASAKVDGMRQVEK